MTNRERLLAVFNNKPVDRVPVGFWFHHLPAGQFDEALGDPQLAEKNIAGHKAFIDAFKPDFVKIMSDGYFHYPVGKGGKYNTADDLAQIEVIDANHPWITAQVELAKRITALQADTPYFYNFFSPLGNLIWIIGEDAFARLFKEAPDRIAGALQRIAKGQLVLTERLVREAGVDGIYFSVSNPDHDVISDNDYSTYVAPGEKYFLDESAKLDAKNILHICGYEGKRNNLKLYSDYIAAAVNWAVNVEGVSLAQGKALFGGHPVIGGFANSPGELIHVGSRLEIEAFTRKILEEAGAVGVAVGADCTIPSDIELARLEWVRDVAAEVSQKLQAVS